MLLRRLLNTAIILASISAVGLKASAQNAPAPAPATAGPSIAAQAQSNGMNLVLLRDSRREGARRVAVLTKSWLYCAPVNKTLYVVPNTYATDFASVPRIGAIFFPPFGDWAEAAVIHDWLYDVGQVGQRKLADTIFKEAIREQSKNGFAIFVMHLSVRMGGGKAYDRATDPKAKEWQTHFLSDTGVEIPPPFNQPTDPRWRAVEDCGIIEKPAVAQCLLEDWVAEQESGVTPTAAEAAAATRQCMSRG